ncbi:MAG TPA: methyltransferase [Arenibaculum sp.]|nr:methyltransferase [Arenibaculum sp.]
MQSPVPPSTTAQPETAETPDALKQRAVILTTRGDNEGALDVLDRAIEAQASDAELFAMRGGCRAAVGRLNQAVEDFSMAVMLSPKSPSFLDALGVHLQQLKMFDQAVMFHVNAIQHAPEQDQPRLFVNLGRAMMGQGNQAAAVELFEAALTAAPGLTDAAVNLSSALSAMRQFARAAEVCTAAIGRNETTELWHNLGVALNRMPGGKSDAIAAFERAVALDPGNRRSRHMLALLKGEEIETIPPGFVSDMFDEYASYYDTDVVEKLKYRVPGLMRRMLLDPRTGKFRYRAVLDIGCGTGLVGVMLRDLTDYLKGIDLSRSMLAQALAKGLYDQIEVADVAETLGSDERRYDAVVAGDVFGYMGRLDDVFSLVHARLEPGGIFTFSVERNETEDFGVLATGRFSHGEAYVRSALQAAGFVMLGIEQEALRVQAGMPVEGLIVLARKP